MSKLRAFESRLAKLRSPTKVSEHPTLFVLSAQRRTAQTLGELGTFCGYDVKVITDVVEALEHAPQIHPVAIMIHYVAVDSKSVLLAKTLLQNSHLRSVPLLILSDKEGGTNGENIFENRSPITFLKHPVNPHALKKQIQQLTHSSHMEQRAESLQAFAEQLLAELIRHENEHSPVTKSHSEGASQSLLPRLGSRLKDPIAEIVGLAQIAQEGQLTSEETGELLQGILHASRDLERVSECFDYVLQLENQTLQVQASYFPTAELIWKLEAHFRGKSTLTKLKADFKVNGSLPREVKSDSRLVYQAISHLVHNAFKFTAGGAVSLVIEYVPENNMLHFIISDTGCGMSKENIEHLFGKPSGSESESTIENSIGVPFVKSVVELLGGTIECSSIEGIGTSFHVHIPSGFDRKLGIEDRLFLEHSSREPLSAHIEPSSLNARILIAEQSSVQRLLYHYYFKNTQIKADFAEDGKTLCRKARVGGYDLILFECTLRGLMPSMAVQTIREVDSTTPLVAVSCIPEDPILAECFAVGCNAALLKPIDVQQMYRLIALYAGVEPVLPEEPAIDLLPNRTVENASEATPAITASGEVLPEILDLVADIGPTIIEFIDGLAVVGERLTQALELGKVQEVQNLARELSGNAGIFGYENLSQKAQEVSVLALKDSTNLAPLLQAINQDICNIEAGKATIQKLLSNPTDNSMMPKEQAPLAPPDIPIHITIPDDLHESAQEFITDFGEDFNRVTKAYQEGNLRRVAFVSNELAGVAALNGIPELCEALLGIERACAAQNQSALKKGFQEVDALVQAVRSYLHCTDQPAAPAASPLVSQSSHEHAPQTNILTSELLLESPDLLPLIQEFLQESHSLSERILLAVQKQHWEELRAVAHEAAGAGGMYGFPSYQEVAKKIQHAAEAKDASQLDTLLADFQDISAAMQRGNSASD